MNESCYIHVSKYLPRKGTETVFFGQENSGSGFQNIYPARGRKLVADQVAFANPWVSKYLPRKGTETLEYEFLHRELKYEFQNIYPARGRKPFAQLFNFVI